MSSIQERLQLKRVPLDTWNIREQLCLASAVVRSGDQNWMSVSRALKTIGEANRPPDWYSQKSCAAQYGVLLENVETPKRKKRNSEGAVETPQESILKMLTQQRIIEIQNTLADMNNQYEQLKNEIAEVRNPSTSDERIQELWTSIEAAKRARERENARRAAWLKEREDRRVRAERTWRPSQTTPPTTPSPAPPSSPLLTSLLKSSPVVTTPQHIPHPASIVDAVSPSAGAPTLSLLLEQPAHAQESKHAAIEHIKSQLVQLEHQLKASTSSPQPAPLPIPAVDIDDIEIKAEDVYAFRDIDIHLPPVTTMHKGPRLPDKQMSKKEEEPPPPLPAPQPADEQALFKEEEEAQEEAGVGEVKAEVETTEEPEFEAVQQREPPPSVPPAPSTPPPSQPELNIPFPEMKFPNLEIKDIHQEEKKIKEEEVEPEDIQPDVPEEPAHEQPPADVQEPREEQHVAETAPAEPTETSEGNQEEVAEIPPPDDAPPPPPLPHEPPPTLQPDDPADIPLPPDEPVTNIEDVHNIPSPPGPPPGEEAADSPGETIEMIQEEINKEEYRQAEERGAEIKEEEANEIKKEEDAEVCSPKDSLPLKEMIQQVPALLSADQVKVERGDEEQHTETDDDTPMELSREEEKDGKKKRDYSRKKKSDSRTCSGSESAAEASAPDSPSAGDERQHRLWRKSVMLVYSRLCAHKYASLFLRPISDEEAPGYSVVVKRPMDLTTIRRNIDAGVIRTTAEFQRDVLLMLSNALMYNSSSHSVYGMAKEMHEEAQCQLGMLLAAQAHAGLEVAPPRRKRRPAPHHAPAKRRHT